MPKSASMCVCGAIQMPIFNNKINAIDIAHICNHDRQKRFANKTATTTTTTTTTTREQNEKKKTRKSYNFIDA